MGWVPSGINAFTVHKKKSVQVNCYAHCNSNHFEKHVQDIYNIYGNTVLINV